MKKPKKYVLAKSDMWTAKKPGCATGYGKSPAMAYRDAVKRKERVQETIKEITGMEERAQRHAVMTLAKRIEKATSDNDELQRLMQSEVSRNKVLEARCRDLEERTKSGAAQVGKARQADKSIVWVAVAMAYFGTTDAAEALEKAKAAGVQPGAGEVNAVGDLKYFVDGWIKHMEKKRA